MNEGTKVLIQESILTCTYISSQQALKCVPNFKQSQ